MPSCTVRGHQPPTEDSVISTYCGYRDSGKTSEQGLKEEIYRLFTPGVAMVDTPGAFLVTQRGAGANMSVDIAVGDGNFVRPTNDYSYWAWSDTVSNATVTAADLTNPRIDSLVAWIDPSVTSLTNSNNPGALKFTAVAGTPAGSPVAPTLSQIQTAIGSSSPYLILANIAVAANASNIVNASITDARRPIAVKSRLWGGTSNTSGHIVPNATDDTVALLTYHTLVTISGMAFSAASPFRVRLPVIIGNGANTNGTGALAIIGTSVYLDPAEFVIPAKTTRIRLRAKITRTVSSDVIEAQLYNFTDSTVLAAVSTDNAPSFGTSTTVAAVSGNDVIMLSGEFTFPAGAKYCYLKIWNKTSVTNTMRIEFAFAEVYWT